MKNAGFLLSYLVFVTSANILLKLAADARGNWIFGVQMVGGMIVFREKIPPLALAGTGLIVSGIVLFSM